MAYPSEYNTYSCPNCEEDVEIPIPHSKYGSCPGCNAKLEIHPDAEFDEDGWHDRTHLSIVDENQKHIERMVAHHKEVGECEHKYQEQTTAPLGVRCTLCGHFVGAHE